MARVWRIFPWDERVPEGGLFSRSYVPPTTGRGRFDLPVDRSPVLYTAESAEHAIAEALQPWRNRTLRAPLLTRAGRPLALVSVEVDASGPGLLDLCDPTTLAELGVGPDRVASRRRRITQPIAADAWERGYTGLRWWSAFWGDWHGVVLFTARLTGLLRFGDPEPLDPENESLRAAAEALRMTLPR